MKKIIEPPLPNPPLQQKALEGRELPHCVAIFLFIRAPAISERKELFTKKKTFHQEEIISQGHQKTHRRLTVNVITGTIANTINNATIYCNSNTVRKI